MGVSFVATLAAALGGATLASLVKLPAAPLLGAMIGVAVLKLAGDITFQIPGPAAWVVYCAVGWLLGQTITAEAVATLRTAAVPVLVAVGLFLVFGLLLAFGLWRFAGLDVHTALIAAAPGGIAQMGVLSAETKANIPIVLAIHLLRVTSVIVLMSIGLKLLGERGG